MRHASFSKVVLALVLILINTCSGCTTRDNGTSPAAGEKTDEQSGVRVLSVDAHNVLLERILIDHRIDSCRLMFESRGLGSRPAASFTVEGVNSEGAHAVVTVMVFAGPDSTTAGTLAFIRGWESGREQTRVSAAVLRTFDGSAVSGTAPIELTEYEVRGDRCVAAFAPLPGDTGTAGQGSGFWNCVGAGSVAGATLCTVKCLPAGPVYAECLIACTGWAILSAIAACAFTELLGN